jgi:hypothetical protein
MKFSLTPSSILCSQYICIDNNKLNQQEKLNSTLKLDLIFFLLNRIIRAVKTTLKSETHDPLRILIKSHRYLFSYKCYKNWYIITYILFALKLNKVYDEIHKSSNQLTVRKIH